MRNYAPPSEDEITCYAYSIYAREYPQHAQEIWRQAEAQLVADRKHDAGLLHPGDEPKPFYEIFGRQK